MARCKGCSNRLEWMRKRWLRYTQPDPIPAGTTFTGNNDLADLDGMGALSEEWLVGGAVVASGNTYTSTASGGERLLYRVSYTDQRGYNHTVVSKSVGPLE